MPDPHGGPRRGRSTDIGKREPRFFPMRQGDRLYVVALLVYTAVAFLPVFREPQLGGISVFGWLMAVLMVLSPAGALTLFVLERRRRARSKDVEAGP